MVGPFITTVAAHADDSVAVDPAGYAQTDETLELDFSATIGETETVGGVVDAEAGEEDLAPVVSQAVGSSNAAANGILIVNDTIIPFDVLPEDVISELPAPGSISEAEYSEALAAIAPYAIAEDEQILAAQLLATGETDVMLSLPFGGDVNWTVEVGDNEHLAAPAGFVEVVTPEEVAEPEAPVAAQAASAEAEAPVAAQAEAPAEAEVPAPAPAADTVEADTVDVETDAVAVKAQASAPVAASVVPQAVGTTVTRPVTTRPTLPVTGTGAMKTAPLAKTGAAPFAAILAAAGLMGSGAGMVTLRRRNTEY